jgi:Flp pilus assembly protein TadG
MDMQYIDRLTRQRARRLSRPSGVLVCTRPRRGWRGQSLVEFALLLPLMLAFLGISIDVARIFQARIVVEAATRDAVEYAATTATTEAAALGEALRIVCTQATAVPGYVAGVTPDACDQPDVAVTDFSRSETAVGASPEFPIVTVRVETTLPFATLFRYPFVSAEGWTIRVAQSYSVVQNR